MTKPSTLKLVQNAQAFQLVGEFEHRLGQKNPENVLLAHTVWVTMVRQISNHGWQSSLQHTK
jgi:hypothetical protein